MLGHVTQRGQKRVSRTREYGACDKKGVCRCLYIKQRTRVERVNRYLEQLMMDNSKARTKGLMRLVLMVPEVVMRL